MVTKRNAKAATIDGDREHALALRKVYPDMRSLAQTFIGDEKQRVEAFQIRLNDLRIMTEQYIASLDDYELGEVEVNYNPGLPNTIKENRMNFLWRVIDLKELIDTMPGLDTLEGN